MRYLTAALLGCLLALTSFAFATVAAHPDNDGRTCDAILAATAAGRAACSYARDLNDCAGRGYGAAYSSRARLDS